MLLSRFHRGVLGLLSIALLALVAGVSRATTSCGPFADMSLGDPFCPFVLEIFTMGITTGTTATTYDPSGNVTRLQMAAFLSRTVDGVLRRGSRRAALNRFWSPLDETVLNVTTVGAFPQFPASDGLDLWAPSFGDSTVSRVRGSDGRLLETWTGAAQAEAALSAFGYVFVTGSSSTGNLYRIDPRQPAGVVTTVAGGIGNLPYGLTFDGGRIWTANFGSVSIVTPGATLPWTVTTITTGFSSSIGALFDGDYVWVTQLVAGTLLRLDPTGKVVQTVTVGSHPYFPIFDGGNIWAPNNNANSVSVVRASTGAIVATLTGNGLDHPIAAAFDGVRILVTNGPGNSVSLWKAADLTAVGTVPTGGASSPFGACSDGVDFWITLNGRDQLARF